MYHRIEQIQVGTYYLRLAAVKNGVIGNYSRTYRVDVDSADIVCTVQRITAQTALIRWFARHAEQQFHLALWKTNSYPPLCYWTADRTTMFSQNYARENSINATVRKTVYRQLNQPEGIWVDTIRGLESHAWYWLYISSGTSLRAGFVTIPPLGDTLQQFTNVVEPSSIHEFLHISADTVTSYYRAASIGSQPILQPFRQPLSEAQHSQYLDSVLAIMVQQGIPIDSVWYSPRHRCTYPCVGVDFLRSTMPFTIILKLRQHDRRAEDFGFFHRVNLRNQRFSPLPEPLPFDISMEFRRYVFKPLRTSVVASAESDDVVQDCTEPRLMLVKPHPLVTDGFVEYCLPTAALVQMEAVNVMGQRVATLLKDVPTAAGHHSQSLPITGLPNGVYHLRMTVTLPSGMVRVCRQSCTVVR